MWYTWRTFSTSAITSASPLSSWGQLLVLFNSLYLKVAQTTEEKLWSQILAFCLCNLMIRVGIAATQLLRSTRSRKSGTKSCHLTPPLRKPVTCQQTHTVSPWGWVSGAKLSHDRILLCYHVPHTLAYWTYGTETAAQRDRQMVVQCGKETLILSKGGQNIFS